ncbi:linear amide C-N hydrolase [Flavobacterium nitrogenifigens]|uniref:Penicillin amidase Cysteine peptidase. MEROPS family C59 n=1 Tax=Flavobacterium nitrogenifigens TaxID=1617283 RepID=A0A521BHM3_9FLAO|nr:linear amide C-N hydrolase [Flavobacterium nitrogenifigens]KAF2339639.1 linear amide C-N hydrolase [Flavobacterium nitrogenifigens]SMO46556.1 penicillin amidase Cysteine peptidase. MEROPS family C59 [Flavobacterium nitrogenifigens]
MCTRILYHGLDELILTARSMDWSSDLHTNLWQLPRGIKRTGEEGSQSIKWTSKYGSVISAVYDMAATDGMNEKGLVANLLWLSESRYPDWDGKKLKLTMAGWVQYVLDNFATVNEAVIELQKEPFVLTTGAMPGEGPKATLHLSISDITGDNAIFEYINGELVIHHSPKYTVMTNSPIFEKQLALNEYWDSIGGLTMLPGTNRAADRFVRASFYSSILPKTKEASTAVAALLSVIRNCSVPLGISTADQPNISSTLWRTISDQKNLVYYFESSQTPNTFWVDFKKVDFSVGAHAKRLNLTNNEVYAGNTTESFVECEPYKIKGSPK